MGIPATAGARRGAGSIGSHLVDARCDAGHQVSVVDLLTTGRVVEWRATTRG
jgi:nucleoside-diphosphate-sugar epimerase